VPFSSTNHATIELQYEHWFGELLVWDTGRLLPLEHPQESNASMHLHVLANVFRLRWLQRNKARYEGKLTPLLHTQALFKAELVRIMNVK
jgi:hypothetical protein